MFVFKKEVWDGVGFGRNCRRWGLGFKIIFIFSVLEVVVVVLCYFLF